MPRPRTSSLPEGVYERRHASGHSTYAIRFRDASGRTVREAAGTSIADAVALRRRRMRAVGDGVYAVGAARTVAEYAANWAERRAAEGVRTAVREGRILADHVVPYLGAMQLAALRPRDVAAWVRTMRAAKTLSPKSVRNTHGVLSAMLARARFDEIIADNPAKALPRGVLPDNVRVRHVAAFSRDECERLISDERVPLDRRVLYAIGAFTGARLGEICGMRWADLDEAARPLRRWVLRTQWDRKPLKTGSPRDVPIHPELWRILSDWRRDGWEQLVCRSPRSEDFVVPRADATMLSTAAGAKAVHRHATLIGIETRAGAGVRDAHSLRRAFITLARTDGAPVDLVERVTHNAKGTQIDCYTYFGWEALCAAVSALRLGRREGKLLRLDLAATVRPETPPTIFEHAAKHAGDVRGFNHSLSLRFLVESRGIEPLTFSMPSRRSPN